MKIWLDDVRTPPDEWFWCKTARDAGYVTEISFDHDLGVTIDGGLAPTGYDLACHIEESAHEGTLKRILWHVHSANPVGCDNIRAAMGSAESAWARHEAA